MQGYPSNQQRPRNHTLRASNTEDYYSAMFELKAQRLTIRDLKQEVADKKQVLQDNLVLQKALQDSKERCSDLASELTTARYDLANVWGWYESTQDQLHDAEDELEQLLHDSEQQAGKISALQTEVDVLKARLQEAQQKLAFQQRLTLAEQQTLSNTKIELAESRVQAAAAERSRRHLSGVLSMVRDTSLGSVAAALAVAPSWGDPAVDVVMWLLLLAYKLIIVPVAVLVALAFAAVAVAVVYGIAYSSTVLVCASGAAASSWSSCRSLVEAGGSFAYHLPATCTLGTGFILQSVACGLSRFCTCCCAAVSRVAEVAAATVAASFESVTACAELVGTCSSRVSNVYLESFIEGASDSSSSSSRMMSQGNSSDADDAACYVMVEVHLGASGVTGMSSACCKSVCCE